MLLVSTSNSGYKALRFSNVSPAMRLLLRIFITDSCLHEGRDACSSFCRGPLLEPCDIGIVFSKGAPRPETKLVRLHLGFIGNSFSARGVFLKPGDVSVVGRRHFACERQLSFNQRRLRACVTPALRRHAGQACGHRRLAGAVVTPRHARAVIL